MRRRRSVPEASRSRVPPSPGTRWRDPLAARGVDIWITQLDAFRLGRRERRLRPPGDQCGLLFRERAMERQSERIDVRPNPETTARIGKARSAI
jgi:hypothetical protein